MEFYAIFVPSNSIERKSNETESYIFTDKNEALNQLKLNKDGRLKAFKTHSEALCFVKKGLKKLSTSVIELKSPTTKKVSREKSQFSQPRSQELVQFRKEIETNNLSLVYQMIWENPRYLVSSGDTPAILKEGPRYNALHVSAISKHAKMAKLILQTIANKDFIQFLHGTTAEETSDEANIILLDSYLNMPEKGRRETPLHFAAKLGAVEVVEALISYPQCKMTPNSDGLYPKDIICARVGNAAAETVEAIKNLLNERYYVPLLRSEDKSTPPIIGEPFLPTNPPILEHGKFSPKREIRAYAGPMDKEQAEHFCKRWKTPPRLIPSPLTNRSITSTPKSLPKKSLSLSMVSPIRPRQILFNKSDGSTNNNILDISNLNSTYLTSTPKRILTFEDTNGNDKILASIDAGIERIDEKADQNSNLPNSNTSNDQMNEKTDTMGNEVIFKNTLEEKLYPTFKDMHSQQYRNVLAADDSTINSDRDESMVGNSYSYYCNETDSFYEIDTIFNSPSYKERNLRLTDTEKGLETIGRNLSYETSIGWHEYWDFLGSFIDISTEKGLGKLESYLKTKTDATENQITKLASPILSRDDSLTSLCAALHKVDINEEFLKNESIKKEVDGSSRNRGQRKYLHDASNNSTTIEASTSAPNVPNPYLCIEKSCLVYTQRFKNIFHGNITEMPNVVCDTLSHAIDKFEKLVLSYIDDSRFNRIDFSNKIHSRYARLTVIFGLGIWNEKINEQDLCDSKDQLLSIFKSNPYSNNLVPDNLQNSSTKAAKQQQQQHKICLWNLIAHYINELLVPFNKSLSNSALQSSALRNPNTIESESDCIDVWMHEISCDCNFENNNENKMQTIRNNRNLMKRRELRRNLFIDKAASTTIELAKPETNLWSLRKTLDLSDEENNSDNNYELADDDNDEIYWSCKSSDNEDTDDLFLTPPESPLNYSDMYIDEKLRSKIHLNVIEDYNIFIEGDEPTKTDMDVLNALQPRNTHIDENMYPHVFKWFCAVQKYKTDHGSDGILLAAHTVKLKIGRIHQDQLKY